jgi:hypothetical protein
VFLARQLQEQVGRPVRLAALGQQLGGAGDVVAPAASQQSLGDLPRQDGSLGRQQVRDDGLAHQGVPPAEPTGVLTEQMGVRGGPSCGEHGVLRPTEDGRQQFPVRVGSAHGCRAQAAVRDGIETGQPATHQRGHRPWDGVRREAGRRRRGGGRPYRLVDELLGQQGQAVGTRDQRRELVHAQPPRSTGGNKGRELRRPQPRESHRVDTRVGGQPVHRRGPRLVLARGRRHEHG